MRKKRLVDDHGTIEDHEGAFSGEKAGGEFSSSGLKDLVTVLIVGIVFLTLALFFRSDIKIDLLHLIESSSDMVIIIFYCCMC